MLFKMGYTAYTLSLIVLYFCDLVCKVKRTAVCFYGSHEGKCESKGLRPDNKIRRVQAILRSDKELHTAKNVIKARVIVGKVIR